MARRNLVRAMRILLGWAVAAVALTPPTSSYSQSEMGRYQLVELREPLVPGGVHMVLRIDTATGQVWKLMTATLPIPKEQQFHPSVKSVSAEGWVLIDEDIGKAIKAQREMMEKVSQRPNP